MNKDVHDFILEFQKTIEPDESIKEMDYIYESKIPNFVITQNNRTKDYNLYKFDSKNKWKLIKTDVTANFKEIEKFWKKLNNNNE